MNQKGMSLIEVVVSLAIMSIVVLMVVQFIEIGLHTSTSATKDANIQKEAQTTVNQLKDWIMETNKGIVCYGPAKEYDQVIAIYNKGTKADENYVQLVFYRKKEKRLYYDKVLISEGEFKGTEAEILAHAQKIASKGNWDGYLLSQYVETFGLDTSKEKEQQVTLSIGYENQGKSYQVKNVIKMRNVPEEDPAAYSK